MDDDYIEIGPGDEITVTAGPDGLPAVKIQNTAWVEPPRWLLFQFPGGDQNARIDRLITALQALRDGTQGH